jgi:hypothetical protein
MQPPEGAKRPDNAPAQITGSDADFEEHLATKRRLAKRTLEEFKQQTSEAQKQ